MQHRVSEGNLLASVELHAHGANKGTELQDAAQHFGIPMENIMAIGDAENDISMLKAAGLGTAVGNATEEALLAADIVLPSHDEDGAMRGIYKYLR